MSFRKHLLFVAYRRIFSENASWKEAFLYIWWGMTTTKNEDWFRVVTSTTVHLWNGAQMHTSCSMLNAQAHVVESSTLEMLSIQIRRNIQQRNEINIRYFMPLILATWTCTACDELLPDKVHIILYPFILNDFPLCLCYAEMAFNISMGSMGDDATCYALLKFRFRAKHLRKRLSSIRNRVFDFQNLYYIIYRYRALKYRFLHI